MFLDEKIYGNTHSTTVAKKNPPHIATKAVREGERKALPKLHIQRLGKP